MAPTPTPAAGAPTGPVLDVAGYGLAYATQAGPFQALQDVHLRVMPGQTVGLVGESGSGKTSLAWAILRYLPDNAVESGGPILLSGQDLRQKTPRQILEIRGRRISMVFQDPSTSLNPTMRMGEQIAEVLMRHRGLTRREATERGQDMLARTGITRPTEMMQRYPHEASGGEKQRVVIASAFACNPEMIIFDEPTTALDIITARQILDLFLQLREETGVAGLYISHDLGLVSRIADEVSVIHRGRIVESGPTARVFGAPREAYTRALLAAVPRPDVRLSGPAPDAATPAVLQATGVTVRYGAKSRLTRMFSRHSDEVLGAADVSFGVRPGELLGVVGESGSGKSSMAKVLAGLQDFEGKVAFAGRGFSRRKAFDRGYRRGVQIVFQHPDASLNPRQRIGQIIARPLKLHGLVPSGQIRAQVATLLEKVLLPADYADRWPHQLSGGEKQRVAIARAFAADPAVVICDEITSSLDVSVQAAIARLLIGLQAETATGCIFITHDLNLVRQLAHRIAVMQHGRLVDLFPADAATDPARHPYTRALLQAVPDPAEVLSRLQTV